MGEPIKTSVTIPVYFSFDVNFEKPEINIDIDLGKLQGDLTEIIVNAIKEASNQITNKEDEKE